MTDFLPPDDPVLKSAWIEKGAASSGSGVVVASASTSSRLAIVQTRAVSRRGAAKTPSAARRVH